MGERVKQYYLSRKSTDILAMLRAAGVEPRSGDGMVINKVMSGESRADAAVSALLKAGRVRRPLFGNGALLIKAEPGEARAIGSRMAAVRLGEEFKKAGGPMDFNAYIYACRKLYGDVYRSPDAFRDENVKSRMSQVFTSFNGSAAGDIEAILADSHGPEMPARRFAALDAGYMLHVLEAIHSFNHDARLLTLEAMRRSVMRYGCAIDFTGLGDYDLARLSDRYVQDEAGVQSELLSRMKFVGMD